MNESEKKEPKENHFFRNEHLPWRILGWFMDLVYLSLMWLVAALPVFTVGAAMTALYDTAVHCVRKGETGLLDRFFSTFKNEFFKASFSCLFWAVMAGLCVLLAIFIPSLSGSWLEGLFLANLIVLGVVVLGAITWVFPMVSRFEMGFLKLNWTAVRMTFHKLLPTLLMSALTILGLLVCVIWIFPVVFVPGLVALLHSFIIEKVFTEFI